MVRHRLRLDTSRWLVLWLSLIGFSAKAQGPSGEAEIDFDRQVRPILSNNCFKCHGPDANERQAELRLDLRDEAMKPADSGEPVIVPGKPDESPLVRRIFSKKKGLQMPPPESNKTLSAAEKQVLKAWVEQGAKYQAHWSFAPPRHPTPTTVKDSTWPRNPIDRFLLARLESEGLRPSGEADRATLIRRVTFDLTGLPPTPADVDRFVNDPAPDAYGKVVDRLLASPRYGERMALDWLDAARFADTNGYHIDNGRDMTRWRDWVIDAFNANKPFDRFTIEQLAGDLLPDASVEQKIASGFNRNHMINFEGGAIPEEYLTAYIVDRVNTTGTVWLGLTIGCAQCHDHKFDPLTQKEYYQLYAFFNNVPENGLDGRTGNAEPLLKVPTPEQQKALDRLSAEIAQADRTLAGQLPEADVAQERWEDESAPAMTEAIPINVARALALPAKSRPDAAKAVIRTYFREQVHAETRPLIARLAALRKERTELEKAIPSTMVMREMPRPRETFMLDRGQYDKKGEKVTPGVPASLPPLLVPEGVTPDRLALARWLVDPGHPLVGRVIANRVWQIFFGTGLVKTAEDFGAQGDLPSHPDLLDWLATEFVAPEEEDARPWDVKRLVRLIVTSSAYRQSSMAPRDLYARDPENRLLARGPRHRLQAEMIRDQALAISGLLDGRIGGSSVSPYQPPGLWEELASRLDGKNWTAQTYTPSHGPDLYRRTMYTFWKRTSPPPTLVTFDAPDRETCTVRRARTNTPLQALVLLNDPTYVEAARKLAERIMTEAGPDPADRIALAFRLATARPPSDAERSVLRNLLDTQRAVYRRNPDAALKLLSVGESKRNESLDPAELAAWSMVASTIMNLDETVNKN